MTTMNAFQGDAHISGNCSDSDDSDVAFANVDFGGVDFGEDDASDGDVEEEVNQKPDDMAQCNDDANAAQDNHVRKGIQTGSEVNVNENASTIPGDFSADKDDSRSSAASLVTSDPGAKHDSVSKCNISSSDRSLRKKDLSSILIEPDPKFELDNNDQLLLAIEKDYLLPRSHDATAGDSKSIDGAFEGGCTEWNDVKHLVEMMEGGMYAEMLRSETTVSIFGSELENDVQSLSLLGDATMMELIKMRLLKYITQESNSKSIFVKCCELELVGVASLNLFLQLNYTGPSMDRGLKPEEGESEKHPLDGINPHGMFQNMSTKDGQSLQSVANQSATLSSSLLPISEEGGSSESKKDESTTIHSLKESNASDAFHNAVLAELAVDGEWPFQVCCTPYFLLFARAILSTLAEPARPFRSWTETKTSPETGDECNVENLSHFISTSKISDFAAGANCLSGASLWNARAIVAHRRLIQTRRDDDDGEACPTLWHEAEEMFTRCLTALCENGANFDDNQRNTFISASVMLEWGLSQHHFRKTGRGKNSFNKAMEVNNLSVEITGADGVRTKYQKKTTAQYLVRAKPAVAVPYSGSDLVESTKNISSDADVEDPNTKKNTHIEAQMIKHDEVSDDAILLEKVKFDEDRDNVHYKLSILDQSILLALCLDVKNDNPMDGLTGEQMGAYLARVLNQHDDWMVYATGLLERAWLECERTHGRERAILQIQALADQHSNRLTLTQSTFKSVEEDSAPAQERLRNLHGIVYPPRWDMLRDLAERYAKLGIVTSAAEIFEELELWDEVVECYRIAGKESKAEEVVRKRLAEKETPRMYAALGDLTRDPKCFERSLELSHGRFYDAHVALGKYYWDSGDLRRGLKHYLDGLEIKPLMPVIWFRVGTISMQLKEWDTAMRAFTEVVQQEPEEADAWANVAAIHMHNKNPSGAYPALVESLKRNRNNWRVWISKLYTCIDLKKYDEAIQACNQVLSMKSRTNAGEGIPPIEERCIRAIIGGTLHNYQQARSSKDLSSLDSSKRTLLRLRELLDKMVSTMKSEAWLYEVSALLNGEMGWTKDVFDDLMKEYRTLQSVQGWEADSYKICKMKNLMKDIFISHITEGTKESLTKCKFLLNGVVKKIRNACFDAEPPEELAELDTMVSKLDELLAAISR